MIRREGVRHLCATMSIEISIYMFSPVLVRWRRQPTWQIKAHILSSRDMFLLND